MAGNSTQEKPRPARGFSLPGRGSVGRRAGPPSPPRHGQAHGTGGSLQASRVLPPAQGLRPASPGRLPRR